MARRVGAESQRLHGCVRDLVALSTMPARWLGQPASAIAEGLRDLLVSMLQADAVRVHLGTLTAGEAEASLLPDRALDELCSPELVRYSSDGSRLRADPHAALRVATFPIGVDKEMGCLIVGSLRPDFPDELERLLMQVAARQVAVALWHAELLARAAAAQSAAERASKLKSDVIGLMSHDLRTPLNAIVGYTQLLEDEIVGPVNDAQRSHLARIRRNQRYLMSVIDNVLGYLRLESGRMQYDVAEVSMAELLAAVQDIILPTMEAKSLRYELHVSDAGLCVPADSAKLQRILLNLLSNAAKFTPPHGEVRVVCTADERTVRIAVHDTGFGIPAEQLESVFEPFVRVTDPRAERAEGTGLGLAICRDFAAGMGGRLTVESTLGEGSVFTLTLPRHI